MTQPPGPPVPGSHRSGMPGPADAQAWNDQQWRRPVEPQPDGPGGATGPAAPAEAPYTGPPKAPPVPPGWRPPTVVAAPPARALPAQNAAALDAAERQAHTVTQGIGMIAGAILLLLIALLCGRIIF